MNRISLILVFMVWLSWTPSRQSPAEAPSFSHFAAILASMACVLIALGVWSRMMANRLSSVTVSRQMRTFNRLTRWMRMLIPLWFAAAVFLSPWPSIVEHLTAPLHGLPLAVPGFVIGTFPAILAWVLMWCAFYPAERALREQTLLEQLDADLPVHTHPTLWQYLIANFRLQILFMVTPIICILMLRDLLTMVLYYRGIPYSDTWELAISIGSMIPVMLAASVLLVRVLPTRPLPPSALRTRLEELCQSQGLRVRNMLLWDTHSNIGNAAVMGVIPGMRYLLVTDLVLETMPDEQILAIFAHEIGHSVHRHLWWIGGCVLCFMFASAGPGQTLWRYLSPYVTLRDDYASLLVLALTAPGFYYLFGYLSRRFERQADTFAARQVDRFIKSDETAASPETLLATPAVSSGKTFITVDGARLVCSALHRIAMVNNIPINAFEWLHGSIAWRMNFLAEAAGRPERTWAFDRQMRRLYLVLILMTLLFAAWTVWESYQ